jgi:hypothetical protein
MKRSFSIKSILAVSLALITSIVSSTASAYKSTSTSVTSCHWDALTNTVQCSLLASAVLSGLRNVTNTPVAYTVTVYDLSGEIFCTNPADNAINGQGTPFTSVPVSLPGAEAITPALVSKNGRVLSEIVIDDPTLIAALADAGIVVTCQNSNWIQRVILTHLRAFGQIVTDGNETATTPTSCDLTSDPLIIDATCTPQDNVLNDCTLPEPYYSNPKSAIDTVVPYSCTEICHDSDPALCYLY